MATPYPSLDGSGRPSRKGERLLRTTFNVVGLGAFVAAPIAAVALWLLLTDPVLASEVAERESFLPLVGGLVVAVGKALAAVLAFL
jgi:hypothetical protein